MESAEPKTELLVIVGPTASGKSALALQIAREFNGEIIAADSRTVYKDMAIGTAKPSLSEQAEIRYWGLDLVEPGQNFSAAQFKDYALEKINDIQGRERLPILVGGTGLYIDGILFNLSFVKTSKLRRFIYSSWSIEKLQKVIQQRDWPLPENLHSKRHLIRTIERRGKTGFKSPDLSASTLVMGLMPPDDILRQRINARVGAIFKAGIVAETNDLLKKYGEKKLRRTGGIAYKFSINVVRGELDKEEAKELIQKAEWQYARRQKTWFRRNKFIHWYQSGEEALTSVRHK